MTNDEMTNDEERDEIIAALPVISSVQSLPPGASNALVYLDSSGDLCILPEVGGWLAVKRADFGVLRADIAPFSG